MSICESKARISLLLRSLVDRGSRAACLHASRSGKSSCVIHNFPNGCCSISSSSAKASSNDSFNAMKVENRLFFTTLVANSPRPSLANISLSADEHVMYLLSVSLLPGLKLLISNPTSDPAATISPHLANASVFASLSRCIVSSFLHVPCSRSPLPSSHW
jgi:hypothetical protein